MSARVAVAGTSGLLFGAGLALGGMTDPARVRGFLDLFGAWDPTLAFVMGGAVLVMAIAWRMQAALETPLFDEKFRLPTRQDLTLPLVGGSALFGVGWGIAGLCPGPGIAMLSTSTTDALIFCAAMLAGMAIYYIIFEMEKQAQPMQVNKLSDDVSVAGQISPEDVAKIAKAGFRAIICNRPDGEAPDQSPSDAVRKAAEAAGIAFHYNPFVPDNLTPETIAAQDRILRNDAGPVFAYCASGRRSSILWALSNPDDIAAEDRIAIAAAAGYDISPFREQL